MDQPVTSTIVGTDADPGDDSFDELLRSALRSEARTLPELAIGTLVDGAYRVDALIGEGGMGRVYRAHDVRLERDVAIKVHVAVAVEGRTWSLREATALARLSHPNVVTVHEVGMWEGHPWVAMEYVPGGTARTWAASRTPAEIRALMIAAGRGLAAAHAAGIVHRDFKPDNVLVGADGAPRVADFGLALQLAKADGRATHLVMGTPAYMAPEQWERGEVGQAADQFAFATSVWELLASERPFRGHTEAELRAQWGSPPRSPARPLPRHVDAALRRALAFEAADRWPTLEPLLVELARDPGRTRRRMFGVAAAAALLVGAGAVASARVAGGDDEPPPCGDALASFATAEQRRARLPADPDPSIARLDGWMARWRTARLAACEDTHVRRTQPVAVLELRELCLDRARVAIEATLVELASGGDRGVLVDALPQVEQCGDVAAIRAAPPLPTDPIARGQLAAIDTSIARVRVHRAAGRIAEGLALAEQLLPRATATGRKALAAEVEILVANLRIGAQRLDGTKQLFEHAAKLAAEAGDDSLLAKAWLSVLDLQAMRYRKPLEAERLIPIVEAALLRAGDPPALRSQALGSIADVDQALGRVTSARARYEEAIALHAKVYGEDSELARKLNRLAAICSTLGDDAAARTHLARAAELLERTYGPGYRHLGVIWTTLGEVEYRAGNFERAQQLLERALAHKERFVGTTSASLLPTLTTLGVVRLWQRDLAGADAVLARAEQLGSRTVGAEDERTVEARRWRAWVLLARHDLVAAERSFAVLAPIARAHGFVVELSSLELGLAQVHLEMDRLDAARADLARARAVVPPGSYMEARALTVTADLDSKQGNAAAARRSLERALAILIATRGSEHPETEAVRARIAIGR